MRRFKDGYWLLASGIATSLVAAPVAAAQSSSVETYGGQQPFVAGAGGGGGGGSADPSAAGSLPFTGMDVMLALGGGLVLLALGFALARATRAHAPAA